MVDPSEAEKLVVFKQILRANEYYGTTLENLAEFCDRTREVTGKRKELSFKELWLGEP